MLYEDEIKKHFIIKIRCKKCGSTNCELKFNDQYGDEEQYLGQDISIECNDCGNMCYYLS